MPNEGRCGQTDVPFSMRPSATPFIPSRLRPCPCPPVRQAHGEQAVVQVQRDQPVSQSQPPPDARKMVQPESSRNPPSASTVGNGETTVAVFPSISRKYFRHTPSVGTWMLSLPGPRMDGRGGLDKLSCHFSGSHIEDREDARLEQLISAASRKAAPSFDRQLNPSLPALRFRPSVGTWLQTYPRRVMGMGAPQLQLQDAEAKGPPPRELPQFRPSDAPTTEKEERLELHFFHLSLGKVDPEAFKTELMLALLGIGFPQELLASLAVGLRAGSVIAEIRGPASSMQK